MKTTASHSNADSIREYAVGEYVASARRKREKTFSINVGEVHRALGLNNVVPSVCSALVSRRFLMENHLRLIAKTGPPSGKSTSVTYTYEFADLPRANEQDVWIRLRGALKNVFSQLGGGENYLRAERESFYGPRQSK
jgi:acetylornithine deacetylase/succinyl-diaminopimelate desuccinylase-like protein